MGGGLAREVEGGEMKVEQSLILIRSSAHVVTRHDHHNSGCASLRTTDLGQGQG